MGVHTGDSVTVAPALTLTDAQYQELRDAAKAIIRKIGVDTGGSNVQFARRSRERRDRGHRDEPARVAQLGPGLQGDRLSDRQDRRHAGRGVHRSTRSPTTSPARRRRASNRPSTTSSSRCRAGPSRSSPWPIPSLTTHMKSVGEAMAIGRTFKESFLKAMRSRELDARPPCRSSAEALGDGPFGALLRSLRAHPARLPPGLQPRRDPRAHGGAALLSGRARRHRRARRRGAPRRAGARAPTPCGASSATASRTAASAS